MLNRTLPNRSFFYKIIVPVIHADRVPYGCPISRLIDRTLCEKNCSLFLRPTGGLPFFTTASATSVQHPTRSPLHSRRGRTPIRSPPPPAPPFLQDTARTRNRMERTSRTEGEREPIEARRRRCAAPSPLLLATGFSRSRGRLDLEWSAQRWGEEACGRGGIEIGLARLVRRSPIGNSARNFVSLRNYEQSGYGGCPSREPKELT